LPLNKAPLMRFSLVRLGRGLGFTWTCHHLLMDGWSLPLVVRELGAVYTALREGREPASLALPPARPFSDYLAWLQKQDVSRAEPFWREELAGFTAPNSLGVVLPAGAGGASGYAEHRLEVSREVTAELQALAARHRLTLQTLTLGAWAVLVSRYSGEEDVVFGGVVSGRPAALPGVETMVGMFVNTLPVRVGVNGAEPLASWLQRLQERQLARQELEHTPLTQIQRWSEVPAGAPLFETLYVFENYPDAEEAGSGSLGIDNLQSLETTNYPITLVLTAADQVSLHLATDRARVDREAAPRLLQNFATLLAGMAERPERRVGELELLTAAELWQILGEWNDTGIEGLAEGCLHHPVARQAARTPSAVAVELGSEQWTYHRLVNSARLLARHLRELGVGPEAIVGLCAERSPAMVVGMLAILEAGGAYLPLDPTYPPERLAFMLDDSGARILLLQEHLRERVGMADGLQVVPLDARWSSDEEMDEPLGVEVTPDHLAYVIYTSGSTGRPKGVMVPHRGICNRLGWAQQLYRLDERDAVLQKASFGFDFSVWECFAPLWAGGRLVLAEPGRQADIPYLVRVLREHRVTFVHFVPSILAAFLAEDGVETCGSLRQVFSGGEALTPELRDRALARLSRLPAAFDNEYGPTETSVDSTRWACAPGQDPRRVPIGRPISNTEVYVVDRELRPVPVGVAGELLVGGAGVTRGYLRRPGLTAERFIPDPFGGISGARLYRTGDLARWLPDGSIDFLGRLDHQVKMRGLRIELGEIEAALVALPGIQQAVAVVRESRLVAYVVGDSVAEEMRPSLREQLRERLPDYMVPAVFVTLPALPLTASGKVDRKALPAPELSAAREEGYVAPRTREEDILAAVWAQVLRLPRVGVNDNFFELGGDSILSIQIVARARQAGLLFTVREVFEHQTVAGLALHVTAADPAGAALPGQGLVTGEVPLTPIQSRFFEQGFADPHHFNQALLLEPREPLSPAALERAMAAIVEHHDALRMRFDGRRQENAPAEPVTPFHQVDLSGLPASRRGEAYDRAAAALQAGFELSTGPLTRLCLFDAGSEPSRLLWVTHHLVVDGVSWRVLLEDFEAVYRQATLPPKTTSFQEWARRLAGHAEALAGELDYWRETVQVSVPRLPVDFPTPEAGGLVGDEATVSFELTVEETTDLLQTLPSVYHSRIDDALLSALVRAFAGWTGSPRLRVDLEGHGREPLFDDLDVSRTVGWFTSLYPVILEAGDADAGAALVNVKERLRAVPGRGIGYGLLRYGGAAGLLETAPAAEVLFNYLGQAGATSEESALFRVSMASTGPCKSPRGQRTHSLEVAGLVTDGRLRVTLTYGSRTHRRETMERLAAAYAGALRQLIQHGQESEEVFTPSDFAKARLDARSFAKVAALLAESD
jgi:amino acid adenylation domain-containing protein/non-ribosomal peptide synthase protein (TIGR01720 family)